MLHEFSASVHESAGQDNVVMAKSRRGSGRVLGWLIYQKQLLSDPEFLDRPGKLDLESTSECSLYPTLKLFYKKD